MHIFFFECREGAKVIWSYVDRILGQPSLIRESSRGKYPWSGLFSHRMSTLLRGTEKGSSLTNGKGFGDVILHPSLQKRIEQLASATANTKSHQAPFRNMLFYGPPGTGKTMAARELAKKSVRNLNPLSCPFFSLKFKIFSVVVLKSTFVILLVAWYFRFSLSLSSRWPSCSVHFLIL